MELLRLRRRACDEDLDADGGQRGEVRLELALDVAVVAGEGTQLDLLHDERRDVEPQRDELQRRDRTFHERVFRVAPLDQVGDLLLRLRPHLHQQPVF